MSVLYTEITLKNEIDTAFAKRGIIKSDEKRYGEAILADGQTGEYPMAGPLEIWWKNRHLVCEALVIPDAPDILLGAWVLEGLDLTINPKREIVGIHGDFVIHRV
jgi:hypothetical protein